MNTENNYAELYYADLTDKGRDILEKNVRDYPASSLAHFLLLYHHKKNSDPCFEEVAKKAGVYLYNPNWVEFQLSKFQADPKNNLADNPDETILAEESKTTGPTEIQEAFEELPEINEEEQNETIESVDLPVETDLVNVEEIDTEEEVAFTSK